MDANRTNPWLAAIAVAALVLAFAALLIAINRGGMMGGSDYRSHHGPGMMDGNGDRDDYGSGMMGGDRNDYGPGMMGRGGVHPSPGR